MNDFSIPIHDFFHILFWISLHLPFLHTHLQPHLYHHLLHSIHIHIHLFHIHYFNLI